MDTETLDTSCTDEDSLSNIARNEQKRNAISLVRCVLFGLHEACDMQVTCPSPSLWCALPCVLELSQVAAVEPHLQAEVERTLNSYTFLHVGEDCAKRVLDILLACR